jgi:carboxylesterase type B
MSHITLQHAKLGSLRCLHDPSTSLIKALGIPYATIPQRFARSRICLHPSSHPSSTTRQKNGVFEATSPGPSSIQPFGSVKSDASNIPLPTENMPEDEDQSEDCLNLSIYIPSSALGASHQQFNTSANLPVLVFIHGGAYFLGSGNRPYYSPVSFLQHVLSRSKPFIFVSINYRLGALGFWHAQTGDGAVPPNNGLHDQLLALEWVQENIAGFGGDKGNVTALGQSAGGESLSVLSMSDEVRNKNLFKRAIMLSGTPVTMPAMTPVEHTENFLRQAGQLGIRTKDRAVEEIAKEVIEKDVDAIRKLAWVGSPCTQTNLFPFEKPSMGMMRTGGPDAWKGRKAAIEAQIVGSTTYDGGISFNMMSKDDSRSEHGKAFEKIATDVLGSSLGAELCRIYGVEAGQDDNDALQKICLFESDIGFFFAALATCQAGLVDKTYFQVFDLPNPFDGPLKEVGEYATHTFDVTTLLGGYDESLLPKGYEDVIASWRDRVLDFVCAGAEPCERYLGGEEGKVLRVGKEGVREVGRKEYMESDGGRRRKLAELADRVDKETGWDVLWVDVCRRFLMRGE